MANFKLHVPPRGGLILLGRRRSAITTWTCRAPRKIRCGRTHALRAAPKARSDALRRRRKPCGRTIERGKWGPTRRPRTRLCPAWRPAAQPAAHPRSAPLVGVKEPSRPGNNPPAVRTKENRAPFCELCSSRTHAKHAAYASRPHRDRGATTEPVPRRPDPTNDRRSAPHREQSSPRGAYISRNPGQRNFLNGRHAKSETATCPAQEHASTTGRPAMRCSTRSPMTRATGRPKK